MLISAVAVIPLKVLGYSCSLYMGCSFAVGTFFLANNLISKDVLLSRLEFSKTLYDVILMIMINNMKNTVGELLTVSSQIHEGLLLVSSLMEEGFSL